MEAIKIDMLDTNYNNNSVGCNGTEPKYHQINGLCFQLTQANVAHSAN